MSWFVYAFIGAIGDATYYALVKKYVKKVPQPVLASGIFLCVSVVTFLLLVFTSSFPVLKPNLLPALAGTVILNFFASLLIYHALSLTDLSLVAPMKSLTPLLLIVTSYLMLKESPTWPGFVGILLIVCGSYVQHSHTALGEFGKNWKKIWQNKGVRAMSIVVVLFSISANLDKMVVQSSSPLFALFATSLCLGLSFLLYSRVGGKTSFVISPSFVRTCLLIALVSVIGGVAINIALSQQKPQTNHPIASLVSNNQENSLEIETGSERRLKKQY